jgi:hypothetical protein
MHKDPEAMDGQKLHEFIVYHLFAGDWMMTHSDLEPTFVRLIVQAVECFREGFHVYACPIFEEFIDLPARIQSQK